MCTLHYVSTLDTREANGKKEGIEIGTGLTIAEVKELFENR
ncbi:hypothetical protein [Flammeovirga sp. SJP92]|nr:hypothetical protein [Flammeovirga sp. SJP92]